MGIFCTRAILSRLKLKLQFLFITVVARVGDSLSHIPMRGSFKSSVDILTMMYIMYSIIFILILCIVEIFFWFFLKKKKKNLFKNSNVKNNFVNLFSMKL